MKLSVVGCPDKKLFLPYVKRAALFYAQSLFKTRTFENLVIKVKFNKKLDAYGYASATEFSPNNKPRQFEIELHPGIGAYDILKTLAHEMVHVRQYIQGDVNIRLTRWKGTAVADVDYWDQPWEIEAHGYESGLFTKFAREEKLWNVFKGVSNPDAPIEPEPLGWKEMDI